MIYRIPFNAQISGSFDECLTECIAYIQLKIQKKALLGVIFFIEASQPESFQDAYRKITSAIEKKGFSFPFNVLAQASSCAVSIEIWLDDDSSKAEYLTFKGIRYTRFLSETGTSIWGIGLHHQDTGASLQKQADETFRLLVELLQNEGLSLSDIVRQWNYIPGILDIESSQGKAIQHYQAFNEVRKHWYARALFDEGYPAATGIGVKTGPFSIDVVAIKSSPLIRKKGLCNPKQENAYQYTQQLLVGDTLHGQCKNPPLFERAKLLNVKDESVVIVSGTAAILGQDTVGVGDVRKQTEISINNMLELTAGTVTGQDASYRFKHLRVYVKNPENRDAVKSVCESFFPDVPASYVLADVCRDNLLIEIEGEAFA